MASDHRMLGPESVEQADHVPDQMEQRIVLDRLRPVGLPIATHVRRYGAKSRACQHAELVAPRIPGLRESVADQHERSQAGLGNVHANAVRFDRTVLNAGHRSLLFSLPLTAPVVAHRGPIRCASCCTPFVALDHSYGDARSSRAHRFSASE